MGIGISFDHLSFGLGFGLQKILLSEYKFDNCIYISNAYFFYFQMKGKRMVAECKFDGDRMQVHKDGEKVWFWSRNGKKHEEYEASIVALLQRQIRSNK